VLENSYRILSRKLRFGKILNSILFLYTKSLQTPVTHTGDGQNKGNTTCDNIGIKLFVLAALKELLVVYILFVYAV